MTTNKTLRRRSALGSLCLSLLLAGCNQIERPKIEPFYAVTVPPRIQELRWTNGKAPNSFDPARAASPPETDLVRATYEGLTELDSRTLKAMPAAAESWRSSKDLRTWTFNLRRESRWSNGEPVTAHDFVRSWKRLVDLGETTANNHLFQNIIGMKTWGSPGDRPGGESKDFLPSPSPGTKTLPSVPESNSAPQKVQPPAAPIARSESEPVSPLDKNGASAAKFGVVAIDDYILQVELHLPDRDFPKLVANPIFSPVFGDGRNFVSSPRDPKAPTNGAFRIAAVEEEVITLERSETYWRKESIALSQVRLVSSPTAEAALEAYKKGDVDVVTNATLEPLAIKLLTPFDDFKRTSHNAVNFYEVNRDRPPFNDRRVRQALALSIDREKLTDGDLQGMTQPAHAFSPLRPKRSDTVSHDVNKANDMLEKAGYPKGIGFPTIRLVVNRNDVQQRVAASVTRMWKQNLNLETEIIVKETSEMDDVRRSGDFDLLRRGVVLPTNDELVNLTAVHGPQIKRPVEYNEDPIDSAQTPGLDALMGEPSVLEESLLYPAAPDDSVAAIPVLPDDTDEALFEMTAIPLYFPLSYALVKPYVMGFELNGLDAPSLKEVSIDNNWQLKKADRES